MIKEASKMMIAVLILLVICIIGIGFVGYRTVYPTPDPMIKIIKQQNDSLKKDNEQLMNKVVLIDQTVYKTRTMVMELKKKDSINMTKPKGIRKDVDKIPDNELKNELNKEYNRNNGTAKPLDTRDKGTGGNNQ